MPLKKMKAAAQKNRADGSNSTSRENLKFHNQNTISDDQNNQCFYELDRLFKCGWSLLPLGGGNDGKSPLVKFQNRSRLPAAVVKTKMQDNGSLTYAIQCKDIVVIDCDSDNQETMNFVKERFGWSDFRTRTPRGLHLFFRRSDGKIPASIRKDKIAIDFKSSANQYVVGAGSIRPDGGQYRHEGKQLSSIQLLPLFNDRLPDIEQNSLQSVKIGNRTITLWKLALQFVECCDTKEELFDELRAQVNYDFEDPENYSDREIQKCVEWTWQKRMENQLLGGEKSKVNIFANEMKLLIPVKNGGDAIALLCVLKHNFDRKPSRSFPIAGEKMAKSGVLPGWSKDRVYRARNTLLEQNLVSEVRPKRCDQNNGKWTAPLFRFGKPLSPSVRGEGF